MNEKLQEKINQIKEKISELDNQKKIQYGILIFLFFAIVVSILYFSTRVQYTLLERNLTPKRAAEMTTKLDEVGIKWKSNDNLSSILVPINEIDKARINLSLSGIIKDEGFNFDDIWSKLSVTQTTADKNRLFLYAQQNSIANSIKSLNSIDDATVILNVKADSAFLNLEEDVATASVNIRTKANRTLTKDEVNGIVNFIATAVKGLSPNKITIIDQNGVQLNNTTLYDGDDSVANSDLKVSTEKRLDDSLGEFLGQIYGKSNVKVKSSVTLNFNKEEQNIIQFSPPVDGQKEGMIRSMNNLKENVSGSRNGSVAGTDTNTTETPNYPTGDVSAQEYLKTQETLNYELNEVNTKIKKAQGQISAISIAVIINKSVLTDGILSEKDKEDLIKLITSASGVDITKNVEVYTSNFYVEDVVPLQDNVIKFLNIPIWIWAIIIVVLIVIIIIIVMLRARKTKSDEVIQDIISQGDEVEEIKAEFQDKSSPKYQIEKFIDEHPDLAAQLLKNWIDEE